MARDLEEIAAELHALPLSDFTRERNAAAKAHPDLADDILALRKPSLAAWVVGLLVRRRPAEVGGAVALGETLREAQEDLDAATLASLTTQRRAVVAALSRRAVELAGAEGVTVSRTVAEDVERTLGAAMRDAAAAAAVTSGRLVRALEAVGFDPVDLDGAVAGAAPIPAARPPQDELAERRARKEAERAAREAAASADAAERDLTRADSAVHKAQEELDRIVERIDQLHEELAQWQSREEPARDALRDAERIRSVAAKEATRLRRIADEREGGSDR